jgi:hypothetical protein
MLAMHRVIHRVHFAVLLARLGGIRFVFVFVQLLPLQPAFFSCPFRGYVLHIGHVICCPARLYDVVVINIYNN